MRILYVTAHYPPDFTSGATLQVRRLAEAQVRAGNQVDVISGSIAGELTDGAVHIEDLDGVRVHWLGTADRIEQDLEANWVNPHAVALVRDVLEARPDVVHAHALQTLGADLLSVAMDDGVPVLVTMHDFWWWCPRLFLVDRQLRPCPLDTRSSRCPCAVSTAHRLERSGRLAPILDRIPQILVPSAAMRDVVITNGVRTECVDIDDNDVDTRSVARPNTPPNSDDVRFLYVGGDHPLKGRDVLLTAARRLRFMRRWRLRMYGVADPMSPVGHWTRHRRVEFLPAFAPANAAAVYAEADVLVIPSVARESFSLAAREALASGLAVITSDCLGPTAVVRHGVNGLVVPLNDAQSLAAAMAALTRDRAHLARLQAAARLHPPPLRSTAEHAASLVARYRELGRRST
jgi:glycosyltransferase involved in cell wall biosynthesis